MSEKFSDGFATTLTSSIGSTTRPATFTVAATSPDLAGGTFSVIIYDAGTDANPVNAEIIEVNDGSTTTWTASTESGHTPSTHAAGSTVRLILTKRSLTQQMTDHTTVGTTPDPHVQYLRKETFGEKGDVFVGTAAGSFTALPVGANGQSLIADSTQPSGMRWSVIGSAASVLTNMGDMIVGGLLGGATRLALGAPGQLLMARRNTAVVATPVAGPTVTANATTGGSLTNGIVYDFAYGWRNYASPDGGDTGRSPITTFTATTTGRADVQVPAAPSPNLTLLVYASVHAGTFALQGTLPNASTSVANTLTVSSVAAGDPPPAFNTTGGITTVWSTVASFGNPMTALGDLIVGAASGVAARLGMGTAGSVLTAQQNTALIADPTTAPTIADPGGTGGSLASGTAYFFKYEWSNGTAPTGGNTLPSPASSSFTATASGWASVTCPAAPTGAVSLLVYTCLTVGGTYQLAVTQGGLSTTASNVVPVAAAGTGATPDTTNTTGGVSPAWSVGTFLTNPMSAVADLIYGGSSGTPVRLPIGTAGQVLSATSGPGIAWTRVVDVMTTIGDTIYGAASGVPTRLPIGTLGQVLTATGSPLVPTWSRAIDVMTTVGDLIAGTTAGAPTRVPGGTTGQILTAVTANVPVWARAIDVMTAVGDLITGGTSGAPARLAPGTSGTYLQSNGPGSALTWTTPAGGGGGGSSASGTGGSVVPIQTQTPTTGALTFTVPSGFKNIFLTMNGRGDTSATTDTLRLQFNGDTGNNYFDQTWQASGTTGVGVDGNATADAHINIGPIPAATAPANSSSGYIIRINDYAGTTFHKTAVALGMDRYGTASGNLENRLSAGSWANTASITSLTLLLSAGNFVSGSTVTLWGEADTAPVLLTTNSNLIQETILTSAQATIPIPTIPQGYRDLRVTITARGDQAATTVNLLLQANGDSGTSYDWQGFAGGSSVAAASGTSFLLGRISAASATAGEPGSYTILLPAYAGTSLRKGIISEGTVVIGNTNLSLDTTSGIWRNTAAITSLTLLLSAGNFATGTAVRVYGEPVSAGGAAVGTGTKVRMSANQTIASATPTLLGWDTEDQDADNQHHVSTASLTGTVTKTAGSPTLTGTGTLFTSELIVGQLISVPGTATEKRVVTAIASDTSLTVNAAYGNTSSAQTATKINSAIVFRQPGFYAVEAAVYSAAIAAGNTVSLGIRLNDATTPIKQVDPAAVNASAGYELSLQRNFSQWDFIEVVWTQTSGGAVDVIADERTHFSVLSRPTVLATPYTQSASAPVLAGGGTISTTGSTASRVAPAAAVSGIIMQAGQYPGQPIWVVNESAAASVVTFAASGTSRVANGTSSTVPGLTAKLYLWDSSTSLWYEQPTGTSASVFGASGASHSTGLVPDPGSSAGSTRYLREDATWVTPTGGGGSSGAGTGGSIVPIQTQNPSGVSSVTFAVPTGFKNLRLSGQVRGDAATTANQLTIRFNGDTGVNYANQHGYMDGTSITANSNTAQTSGDVTGIAQANALANSGTTFNTFITNHAGSFLKNWSTHAMGTENGTTITGVQEDIYGGVWASTAAITSITLAPSAGNFVAGSTITLWGEADTAPVLLTVNSNLIFETVLTGTQATIDTGTLSQSYRDLRIEVHARGDASAGNTGLRVRFNNDSGTNYLNQREGAFSTTATNAATLATSIDTFQISGGTSTANAFSPVHMVIPDYTSTVGQKGLVGTDLFNFDNGNSIQIDQVGSIWRSTAAITSIQFFPASGNFVTGTSVRVYGEPASAGGPSVGTGTRARISTNQSIPSGAVTLVAYDVEDNDSDNQHYTSAAALTGTVAKAVGSATLTGTGTLFTTELSVGQVISVPGTANEVRVVIAIASSTSLTVNSPFANAASAQTATRVNTPFVFRTSGMYTVDVGNYLASVASGNVTIQARLNGSTIIKQDDLPGINANAGYSLSVTRQFQMWDYIEILVAQSTGSAVNLVSDERTSIAISARPTAIVAVPYANIQDQKPSATNSGTFTSGAWRTRDLNKVASDTVGLVLSLSSNQFTLGPGTYRTSALVPAYGVNNHQARLQNITDAVTTLYGTSEYIASTDGGTTRSVITGKFQITGVKTFEIQHQCNTDRTSIGFGNITSYGNINIFTNVEIWKEG